MAISNETKSAISALEPATLEAHGVIQKAKTGYICPLCGNGEGKDGTGIDLHEVNGTYLGKCFKCGIDSVADAVRAYTKRQADDEQFHSC